MTLRVLLRAVPWPAVLVPSLAAAGAGAGAALSGPSGLGLRLCQIAIALVGGAAAGALDEPAAAVVAACPVRRARLLAVRALAAGAPLLVGATVLLVLWDRLALDRFAPLELGGCWALGFSLAVLARRRLDEPAELVGSGLVLALLTVVHVEPLARTVALFPDPGAGRRPVGTWGLLLAGCAAGLLAVVPERRWHPR